MPFALENKFLRTEDFLFPANATRSPIVSLTRSLNIIRSMSNVASAISTGQSPRPVIASPTKSFRGTLQPISNKSSVVSRSLILWNSDQTWCNEGFSILEFDRDKTFHGGISLSLSRISETVSKISFLSRLETPEVSFPLRYCCFSNNWNIS